jgi:GDP-4-dehydro-6-deoxy-D-mannose reductase
MRVLVTGANGFVGRHLVAALRARGHAVAGAGHLGDAGSAGVLDHGLDLADFENVRGVLAATKPEAVVHLAGRAFVPDATADPLGAYDINAGGTARLLEAVREFAPAARVVVASSAEVYGDQPRSAYPLTEAVLPNPVNPYAASKVAAEAYALAAAHTYALDVIVTRAFNHIGPGQDGRFVVPSFARQLAEIAAGAEPVLAVGNLEAQRDFLDVRDAVGAYVLLAERTGGASGTIYNIARGEAVAIREILRRLITIAHVPVEVREDSGRIRPADVPLILGDASRLRAATGWVPHIALDRSLRDIYADASQRVIAAR